MTVTQSQMPIPSMLPRHSSAPSQLVQQQTTLSRQMNAPAFLLEPLCSRHPQQNHPKMLVKSIQVQLHKQLVDSHATAHQQSHSHLSIRTPTPVPTSCNPTAKPTKQRIADFACPWPGDSCSHTLPPLTLHVLPQLAPFCGKAVDPHQLHCYGVSVRRRC